MVYTVNYFITYLLDPGLAAAYNQCGLIYKTMFEIHYQFVNDYYNNKNNIDDNRVSREDALSRKAWGQAIEDFDTGIGLDPHNATFYKNYGETLNKGSFGKSEESINDYGKATRRDNQS
jgi:tetratricopeptide (TPR) repeat protein